MRLAARRNDPSAEQVGGDEPPPRYSVQRWAALREHLVRSTVPVGGCRSPQTFGYPMTMQAKSGVSGRLNRCLLLVSVVLLPACNPTANTPQGSTSGNSTKNQNWSVEIVDSTLTDADIHHNDGVTFANSIHGVDYAVHGGLPGSVKIEGKRITITSGSNLLEVKGGLLFVNGKESGSIQEGDKVVLGDDGQLWVNEKKR